MDFLERLKKAIVASGSITAEDVSALHEVIYTNGKVEQEKAEFLFQLRKELNDLGNLTEWDNFFIQAICDFILDDERSPEAIDDGEAIWLINQIGENGYIDLVEQKLLKRLRKEAKHFPNSLQEIQKHVNIAKDLAKRIFLLLCGNSKTMRSMEFGVSRMGHRKDSVSLIKNKKL